MKILALTPQLPYPPMQGTTLRNFYLLRELGQRHEISLLTFFQPGDTLGADSPLHAFCREIRTVPAPPRRGLAQRALTSVISALPDMALRLPSAQFAAALREWLASERFDVIQVEGIEMAAYGLQVRREAASRQGGVRAGLSPSPAPHLGGAGRPPRSQLEAVSRRARLVFDDHNAEYVLQRSAFQSDVRRPARWHAALYSFVQWQKLAHYERQVLRAHDAVAAVSQTDAHALQRIAPGLVVNVVPNGVDTDEFAPTGPRLPFGPAGEAASGDPHPVLGLPPDRPEPGPRAGGLQVAGTAVQTSERVPPSPPTPLPLHGRGGADLVFTGKMDYRPNIDAALWFAEEIMPRVRAQAPASRFIIVGQQPHARLAPLAQRDDVVLTGWVEDVRPYIASAAVYVAPLRMGGGTRLKVLQAMSMARPIVSTTLGCDGLSVQSGREALLADTPEAFAEAVVRLLHDEALCRQLGAQARQLAIAQYDWRRIGPLMEACYAA
jgi:polysaccharide biosynthesis protein PslH